MSRQAGDDRRYNDREFDLILKRAFELEERAPQSLPTAKGLSLVDIRSIASEVGLDPATIDRAAALLPEERAGTLSKLLGGPESISFEMQIDGELDQDDYGVVLQTIRRALKQRGESGTTGTVLDWKTVGRTDQVFVTVTPRAGRTSVDVVADRQPALLLATVLPTLGWAFIAASVGAATEPTSAVAISALFGAAGLGALATSRLIWQTSTDRMRSAVERLTTLLHREISELNRHRDAPPDTDPADPEA